MDIGILFNQLIQLFIIICVGYLLYKRNITTIDVNQRLTKLILNVTLPAMMINSVLVLTNRPDSLSVITVFIVSVIAFIVLPIISFIVIKVLRFPFHQQGLYMFMNIFSNVGYMGFPVLQAVLGDVAVFYAAIFNIVFNLCSFSYGVVIMGYGTDKDFKLDFKKLKAPGVTFSILAIIIYALNIHFPITIENSIKTLGGLTSPLSMILIGSTLATIQLKEVFKDWHIYLFAFVKQLAIPILLSPILRFFITDDLIYNVIMILLLMPVANSAVLFATEHGHDEKLAAKTVFITTVLSIITIPIGIMICQKL